ncbi:MAG: linear amide C-N hydrolase [Bacteroidaceae bacterium]|nr:linear amide C-N hydrolase [Bacteroidaceae bacterium]
MKQTSIISLCLVSVLVFNTGCEKDDTPELEKPKYRITENIRQLGAPVTNPINSEKCNDSESAKTTLSSLRRISDRFYYMDFTTNLHFEKLVANEMPTHSSNHNAMEELWFKKDGQEPPFDEEHPQQSCSGFVCFNEKGEVLFGRNFDGAGGPLCLLFNKANGYRYIQFTAPNYNSATYNGVSKKTPKENGDGILSNDTTSLHRLLRQPMATMDGINEYGLCFGAFQLPVFADNEHGTSGPTRVLQNEGGKGYVANSLMQNFILSKCKTVKEVEMMLRQYNYVSLHPSINVHWMVADATGDYAIFEYWENKLYVLRPEDRQNIVPFTSQIIPYEYNSVENYYANLEATKTYLSDVWQYGFSNKVRVGHLMDTYADKVHLVQFGTKYKPVMSEMEALECLQAGSFAVEMCGNATNWSCIYNPAQKTILFNMRNDMSHIYKIDFNKDF